MEDLGNDSSTDRGGRGTTFGMTRFELFTVIEAAVHEALPDRAETLIGALAARLEPGIWSLRIAERQRKARIGGAMSVRPPRLDRDKLMQEIGRAVRHHQPERGEEILRALERWLVHSRICALQGIVGEGMTELDDMPALIDWAADALEEGLDSESLRILAGFSERTPREEFGDYLQRTARELSLPRFTEEMCVGVRSRAMAWDLLSGEITVDRARQRMSPNSQQYGYEHRVLRPWFLALDEFTDDRTGRLDSESARERLLEVARGLLAVSPEPDLG
jgi:hypothetical protein